MDWTLAQMVAHHASNGCPLKPGDLIGSGTVSGPEKENRGCLLELTWRETEPLQLPGGEVRRFLEDGDEVILRGFCEAPGFRRIGLGECRGTILAAGTWGQERDFFLPRRTARYNHSNPKEPMSKPSHKRPPFPNYHTKEK